jgi:hypothetical protein
MCDKAKLEESLGEALCISLGATLGNMAIGCWFGVELDIVEGVTLASELEESLGEALCMIPTGSKAG